MLPRPALPLSARPFSARPWLARLGRHLPGQCAVCRGWPSQPVCAPCLQRFNQPAQRCPGCALAWTPRPGGPLRCPDCLRQPLALDLCFAAMDYAYPWAELLGRMKFQQATGWSTFFAERLAGQSDVAALLAQLEPGDWLLPLPLSRERLAERGFNQAWELAKALHRRCGSPARARADLLLRVRHALPQSELRRNQRLANVEGAFAVDPLLVAELTGRRVVLIDDVMTTGASLSAAAQALKAAGARSVVGVVAARTPP